MIKTNPSSATEFVVIHPMFDVEEQKCDGAGLGRAKLSPVARVFLVLLRAYVIGVLLLLAAHSVESGWLGRLFSR